jgi:hypothetical protein
MRERPSRRRINVAARVRQWFDLPVVDVLDGSSVFQAPTQVMRQTA